MQVKFEQTHDSSTNLDTKVVEIGVLNKLLYEIQILLINFDASIRKVVFEFVQKTKSLEFPKGNGKLPHPC